jgi:hypothetical protein
MIAGVTLTCSLPKRRDSRGKEQLDAAPHSPGRTQRIARLLALALHCDALIREGHIADYAALAALGHVTRPRVTQIMNLLYLAPDIQEEILFLPKVERGRDPIHLWDLQPIAVVLDWHENESCGARCRRRASVLSAPASSAGQRAELAGSRLAVCPAKSIAPVPSNELSRTNSPITSLWPHLATSAAPASARLKTCSTWLPIFRKTSCSSVRSSAGWEPINFRDLKAIAGFLEWNQQRARWRQMKAIRTWRRR